MIAIIFILSLVFLTQSVSSRNDLATFENFQNFLKNYGKIYHTFEDLKLRFDIFSFNVKKSQESGHSHLTGVSKFSDLTSEEFEANFLNLKVVSQESMTQSANSVFANKNKFLKAKQSLPEEFDWRALNLVTEVKNMQECGQSHVFAATATIEAQFAKRTSKLVSFSEQLNLNCENNNCEGGFVTDAFKHKELLLDGNYESGVKVAGFSVAGSEDEETIKEYLYSTGPIAVGINGKALKDYRSGIIDLDNENCDKNDVNFAVTLVGYGTENGKAFWIVKNQFGLNWGEQGYFRIKRGSATCGIGTFAVAAVLA